MRSVRDTFIVKQEHDISVLVEKELKAWVYKKVQNNIVDKFRESMYEAWNTIAIVSEKARISYKELNILTDSMAHMMLKRGVQKGDHIAIVGDRSIESIISMIGILKVGAVYIPLDSKIPISRIEFILEDCKPKYILNLAHLTIKRKFSEIDITELPRYSPKFLYTDVDGEDIAYILYTSGTTGYPKGTLIRHKSVINLSNWFNQEYNISKNRNVLHMTNISFDVSVEEIFSTLLNKGTLFIISDKDKSSPKIFWNYLLQNKINIAQFVPATLNYLLGSQPKLSELRVIICGGEKLDFKTKNIILDKGYELYNHYGPTETTVDAITCKASKDKDIIGKPILNTYAYILNSNNELVEVGEVGELCISGVGLAKGYLNNEELTKEKFTSNPFVQGEIMYRTGDRAKYNEDNEIIFCGRFDEQIKINGVRIEIEDIELNILKYKGISSIAVVDKKQDSRKVLCAYFTSDEEINIKDLKLFCKKNMPLAMVPHYFIKIESMPLSVNEKIDKKKLEFLPIKDTNAHRYVKQGNGIETEVIEIWKEVLGIENIGLNTVFNESGGDSMGAAWLCAEIEEKFSILFPLNLVLNDGFCVSDCCKIISNKHREVINHGKMVLLSNGENVQDNLFFVHGGNGEPGGFALISNFMKGYNCWGFRADVLDGLAPTNIKIEQIARDYIIQLKKIQSKGPYNIIGWCIGGSIAYEIALQLEQEGNEVGFLSLVNTFAPNRQFWGKVNEFNLHTEIKEINKFMGSYDKKISDDYPLSAIWNDAVKMIETKFSQMDKFKKYVYDDMDRAIPNFESNNIKISDIIYYINVMRTFDNARALYFPKGKVKAQCYFFKATYEMVVNADAWQNFFEKPIMFCDIRGNNFSIWKDDNISHFAAKLKKRLGE